MTDGNQNYNGYISKLIEFVEKQTTAQIEQKNSTKNLQNSVNEVKKDTNDILKKITRMTTIAAAIGAILVLAWGFISFTVDNIVDNKIEGYISQSEEDCKEKKEIRKMIEDIIENRNKE